MQCHSDRDDRAAVNLIGGSVPKLSAKPAVPNEKLMIDWPEAMRRTYTP